MKTKTLLIAAAMVLCFSAASFAQSIYSTSSTPITTVIASGNAELAGNITFTCASGTSVSGTISIQYGGSNVNITSPFSGTPPGARVTITTVGGGGGAAGVNLTASQYSPGLLVIDVPAGLVAPYTITVSNVRVQINGTGLTNLVANLSATGNLIAAGSTSLTVINSTTGVGIASNASYKEAPGTALGTANSVPVISAVTGLITPTAANTTIVVKEGFLSAFSIGVGVRVTVSATPMKGVSFSFPATASSYDTTGTNNTNLSTWARGVSTSQTATGTAGTISSSSTSSSSLQMYYYVATEGSLSPTTIEQLEIPVTIISNTATETFPLAAGTFTYTVSLAPVAGPYITDSSSADFGTPRGITLVPRFAALESAAANLATITGSSSSLLIPYAYASQTAGDYNTAMAISNTSEDPGTTILGFTGAIPQSGSVTFYLFPQNSTLPMFKYTTAAGSPGAGLDASGNIVAGGTYSVFLNQLLPLATPPTGSTATLGTSFTGYIIVVPNFTNAHGTFVLSNFTNLTMQSGLMLVLSDRSVLPEKLLF